MDRLRPIWPDEAAAFIASVESAREVHDRMSPRPWPLDPKRSEYAQRYTKGFKPGRPKP